MLEQIQHIREQFERELREANDSSALEALRIKFLARKGLIAQLFDGLRTVPPSDRPAVGKALNELRAFAQRAYDNASSRSALRPAREGIDLSLPGRPRPVGTRHPITQTIGDLKRIFASMGFGIAYGPDIEDDYHNFTALNFAPEHPARDMQDTFFISKNVLLRTHTSP
ncbi:MAG: phenylalanine--tRNA ligase subunit alpha, partial [Ignavibacteriales bacterium]|nr:phenylalanine--tRNA ligase subunit alpha [Ignavibacteriales bacterium]